VNKQEDIITATYYPEAKESLTLPKGCIEIQRHEPIVKEVKRSMSVSDFIKHSTIV
jgi:hypothetical protein